MKCVACGSANLIEGTVPLNPKDELKFNPGGRSMKDRFFMDGRNVRAFACLHCHHLQLAVDFQPDDLERYQEFEETPASIVEAQKEERQEVVGQDDTND